MADEADGVNEAWERTAGGSTRVALTAAGQLVELAARARQREAGAAEADALQRAREMTARSDAERSAARALLAATERPDWWIKAEPGDVAGAWQTARAWGGIDSDAARAADRIREQVRNRYGIDPVAAGTDPLVLREVLESRTGAEATTTSDVRARERGEVAEATALMAAADRSDAREAQVQRLESATDPVTGVRDGEPRTASVAARDDGKAGPRDSVRDGEASTAGARWDSAERRRAMAASLEGIADHEAAQARVMADVHQGKPVDLAPAGLPGKSPRARTRRASVNRGSEQGRTLGR